ncbi:MAG: hypothetical protein AAB512_00015 [Patescibacteria group bacterium]
MAESREGDMPLEVGQCKAVEFPRLETSYDHPFKIDSVNKYLKDLHTQGLELVSVVAITNPNAGDKVSSHVAIVRKSQ